MADSLFVRALKFPMSDDDWIKTVGIGGLFNLLGIFFVPSLFVNGFLVEVIRESLGEDDDLPEFEDFVWEDLAVTGLKMAVIGFAVAAVFMVVYVITVILSFGGLLLTQSIEAMMIVSLLRWVILLPILLVSMYITPIMTVNLAREDSVSAAFDINVISQVATTEEYLIGWLTVAGIQVVHFLLMAVFAVTIIGLLFLPWLAFYFMVSSVYAYGRVFSEVVEDTDLAWTDEFSGDDLA